MDIRRSLSKWVRGRRSQTCRAGVGDNACFAVALRQAYAPSP
ncbi:MAG: hypothetical protein ABIK09_19385 [Pseudomonadota bacterium]